MTVRTRDVGVAPTRVVCGSGLIRNTRFDTWLPGGLDSVSALFLVSDQEILNHFGKDLISSLKTLEAPIHQHMVPAGEAGKSLECVRLLHGAMAHAGFDRDVLVVALGGGAISDLAGFAAGTWMRGVRWVIVPTSLIGQIDASIGGKTGINLPEGKNLVGLFHPPGLVVTDVNCLVTLSEVAFRGGLVESVKHALIASPSLLDWQERHLASLLRRTPALLEELVWRNVLIKSDIVERDPLERGGERVLLNLGHTIGHALEAHWGFERSHGECVALGLIGACRISSALGVLQAEVVERVAVILQALGLSTRILGSEDVDAVIRRIRLDKKRRRGAIRMVLLRDVGRPVVCEDVSEGVVRAGIESLIS